MYFPGCQHRADNTYWPPPGERPGSVSTTQGRGCFQTDELSNTCDNTHVQAECHLLHGLGLQLLPLHTQAWKVELFIPVFRFVKALAIERNGNLSFSERDDCRCQ